MLEINSYSIPKIIHYCWFGRSVKSKFVLNCINTWKKHLPEYQIVEWNEDNFSINYNNYVSEAYHSKKFAFVSDVARLYALNKYGGIYFDIDIEVLKSLDDYLNAKMIFAFESKMLLMTGFFASTPNNEIISEFLNSYNTRHFINSDGSLNTIANTVYLTELMVSHGLKLNGSPQKFENNILVFPMEIFGAFDADNSAFVIDKQKTVLVHRCMASWSGGKFKVTFKLKRSLAKLLGRDRYQKLRLWIKKRGKRR